MTEEKKNSTEADAKVDKEETSEEKDVSKEVKDDAKASENKDDKKCTGDSCKEDSCCGTDGKNVFVWIIIGVIIIGIIMFLMGKKNDKEVEGGEATAVSEEIAEQVKMKTEEMLGTLVPPEIPMEIGEVMEQSGLYRITITVDGQEVDSYMTKDMTKFIPQLLEMEELATEDEMMEEEMPAVEVQTKSAKPEVEVFVMSHCPYGTQIEKGILPVIETLGDKIDATFKFVDYAMHGEKEVTEQLRQYCIQENEPQKFNEYLSCFLESGEAAVCDTSVAINQTLLNQCVAITDAAHQVTALLEDESSWVSGQFPQFNVHKEDNEKYGVEGSPTLVINGEVVQAGRDSASLLAAVCSGFDEQPVECQEELSSASPSPGFGGGTDATGASADAGCGV